MVGDFAGIHVTVTMRTVSHGRMKNTVNAFAKEHGDAARQPETFGLALARHCVTDVDPVHRARITLEMYPWRRLSTRFAASTCVRPRRRARAHGDRDLRRARRLGRERRQGPRPAQDHGLRVLRASSQERYTTLPPTRDRVLATSVTAQWWHTDPDADWAGSFANAVATMTDVFAGHHSLALQQTMFAMGEALIDGSRGSARCGSRSPTSTTSSST